MFAFTQSSRCGTTRGVKTSHPAHRDPGHDNALAESFVDSFKTELITDRVWRTRSQLELAVVEYIGWYNAARLHERLGDIPPAEYEQLHALEEPITLVGATA